MNESFFAIGIILLVFVSVYFYTKRREGIAADSGLSRDRILAQNAQKTLKKNYDYSDFVPYFIAAHAWWFSVLFFPQSMTSVMMIIGMLGFPLLPLFFWYAFLTRKMGCSPLKTTLFLFGVVILVVFLIS